MASISLTVLGNSQSHKPAEWFLSNLSEDWQKHHRDFVVADLVSQPNLNGHRIRLIHANGGPGMEVWSVVGAIGAAFVTAYFTTAYKLRREHLLDIDRELRESRIEAFETPWKELKLLSMHREPPSYEQLAAAVGTLTDWYYESGGIYLTSHSQPAFVACVSSIRDVARADETRSRSTRIDPSTQKLLFDLGSAFRTQMTLDLGSRFESEFQSQDHKRTRSAATKKSTAKATELSAMLKRQRP